MLKDLKKTLNLMLLDKVAKSKPMGDIQDKVVVITGASKGIGLATGQYLHSEGCKIVAISRHMEELKTAFPQQTYNNALLLEADVTNKEQINQAITTALKHFGKIDVVVNNVGVNTNKPLEESTDEDINRIIDTNIKGALNTAIAVIPSMKAAKAGTIINIGSKISHNTNIKPNKVLYATSKYAIEGMSYALSKELMEFGIRVVCLMPATVNTFVSVKSGTYLSPTRVAQMIGMVIKFEDVDFDGIVFKSREQNI